MSIIDLNCDMGELPELVFGSTQEALFPFVTSVNVACGAHAGSPEMMDATLRAALRHNVRIGAHPGYPDPTHFGRLELNLSPEALAASVHAQLLALQRAASACRAAISHVKPHGALYNSAARNPAIAAAFAHGVALWSRDVTLVGLAGSIMLSVFANAGFPVAAEAFADRRYAPDGSLLPRSNAGSVIEDPQAAADQAWSIATCHSVCTAGGSEIPIHAQTLCIHSDTPGAVSIAAAVAARLRTGTIDMCR
jgi:UPF0271 protein